MARKSALSGRTVVDPVTDQQANPEDPPAATQEPAEPSEAHNPPEKAAKLGERGSTGAKAKKKKVSFYQLPEEEDRARAAWMHTMGQTGHTTITSFMEAAVATYTRQLEAQHNDSKPFN